MYLPEYSITGKILSNIAQISYCKAVIENTAILPNWERQLKKDARIKSIYGSLKFLGTNVTEDDVKKFLDGVNPIPYLIKNYIDTLEYVENNDLHELDERHLKEIDKKLLGGATGGGSYRKRYIQHKTKPEEILAKVVELTDWYNSLDGKETHPVVLAAIVKAKLETIHPFEQTNFMISNLVAKLILNTNGYGMKNYLSLEEGYANTKKDYERFIENCDSDEEMTKWIEYFTEEMCLEISNIKEKVALLARDTKVAKVSGRVALTDRQERIVEFIQDYGQLQNKDFAKLFPGISEDTVLRDLKTLINKNIIVKNGSTKSSRYELKI